MIFYKYSKLTTSKIIYFLFTAALLSSCIPHKNIVYMQQKAGKSQKETFVVPTYIYTVAKGDILGVDISTFTKGGINSLSDNITQKSSTGGSTTDPMQGGYMVDTQGNIALPLLGILNVEGLTLEQVQELITKKATEYINNPIIRVRMLSFYITFLGDVSRPGRILVTSPSINIYEALALAGDLQLTANQQKVRVIRIVKGEATTFYVDLNSADVFKSEVFYLKPGDLIYVEPTKVKVVNQNMTALTVTTTILNTILFITNILFVTKIIQ